MKRLQVLIIDDDRIYALGLKAWLKALGIVSCARAADAVPYNDDYLPDMVLIDPELAGIRQSSMIREVKRRFPSSRIIVLGRSQWFKEGFAGNAMAAGADAFFCKGLPDEELFITMTNLLDLALFQQSAERSGERGEAALAG